MSAHTGGCKHLKLNRSKVTALTCHPLCWFVYVFKERTQELLSSRSVQEVPAFRIPLQSMRVCETTFFFVKLSFHRSCWYRNTRKYTSVIVLSIFFSNRAEIKYHCLRFQFKQPLHLLTLIAIWNTNNLNLELVWSGVVRCNAPIQPFGGAR